MYTDIGTEGEKQMDREKVLKIVKVTAAALAGVLVLSAAGAFVAFNYVVKPKSKQIIKAVDELLSDEDIRKAVEPYLQPGEADELLKSIDESSLVSNAAASEAPAADEEEKTTEENDGKKDKTEEKAQGGTASQAPAKTTAPKQPAKKRSEYNSQYDYVKDNVPTSDFSKGLALASRVDMGYISGLLSGGLTAAEKSELKSYLTSRFSSSEIAEGISLYSKYSHLLR